MHLYSDETGTYDIIKLWELTKDLPAFDVPLDTLTFNLDESEWSNEDKIYDDNDYVLPHRVLRYRELYPNNFNRILKSDLNYSVLISKNKYIIDGLHRVCKCIIYDIDLISVKLVPDTILIQAKINND